MLLAPRLEVKVRLGDWLKAKDVTKRVTIANSLENNLSLIFFNWNYLIGSVKY
jgi:hypothetical protein